MSGGFYERLSAISSDPSSPDSMTELVVAALGSFGRYYICWKTRSGEYRQESSGLPAPLQEWLFPSEEGQQRTRDFATLQVVLGHGDDFFAADRDGKIERKAASSSAASTPDRTASPQPNNDRQYLSPSPMSNRPLDRAARRRSRTMSLIGPPASSFRLSQAVSPISEFPGDPSRGGHGARGSSISMSSIGSAGQRLSGSGVKAVARPLAVARTNADWRTRPRTIALGEEQLRIPEGGLRAREQVPLRARGASSPPQPPPGMGRGEVGGWGGGGGGGGAACCQCGCHATAQTPSSSAAAMQTTTGVREQRPSYATASVQAKVEPADPPPPPPRPKYVDTAVQTDPPPRVRRSPSSSSRKRHSVTSSYSDTGTFPSSNYSSYLSSTSSRRSSAAATDITTPSTYEGGAPSGNPVLMGKMQDYFRSTGYQLGDALRPTQYGVGYGVGYGGIETGWFSAW
ncbi:hypothetical protein DIS24_g6698 [Lasiodiplodia hormozganensis]|uniref:Uncharacterized protein n=1 Tax=Lasiodiplodia hormozganensis TaxID=869390 RepID=A0AA39YFM8_9PEZI|nr:hypothetical protein DIS24_g6698 [Lasiodiplodia hormozganensis]